MTEDPERISVPTEKLLPTTPDAVAPDGSLVRLLAHVAGGGLAHFELGPGQVSIAQKHRTVSEIWYVIAGLGTMWRRSAEGVETEIDLRPSTALTIPVGTAFQFRSTSRVPLEAIGATMPPWPGEAEAQRVEGPWKPTV